MTVMRKHYWTKISRKKSKLKSNTSIYTIDLEFTLPEGLKHYYKVENSPVFLKIKYKIISLHFQENFILIEIEN